MKIGKLNRMKQCRTTTRQSPVCLCFSCIRRGSFHKSQGNERGKIERNRNQGKKWRAVQNPTGIYSEALPPVFGLKSDLFDRRVNRQPPPSFYGKIEINDFNQLIHNIDDLFVLFVHIFKIHTETFVPYDLFRDFIQL